MTGDIFPKNKDEMLIKMVRNYPILYDQMDENFRNVIMKYQIWEKISNELGVPLLDAKKRWRHFRDYSLKKRKRFDAGLLKDKWGYMRQLEFLLPYQPRRPRYDLGSIGGLGGTSGSLGDVDRVVYLVPTDCDASRRSEDTDEDTADQRAESGKRKRKYSSDSSAAEYEDPASSGASEGRPAERSQRPAAAAVAAGPAAVAAVAAAPASRSATHKFFESMADIVAQFPAPQAAAARLRVCQLVAELEVAVHSDRGHCSDSTLLPVKREL